MKRIWRLLVYARPYVLYSLGSVVLMAIVGAMASGQFAAAHASGGRKGVAANSKTNGFHGS